MTTPRDAFGVPLSERKPRLLVVDDQPLHLQVLHKALATNCQMFLATSGEQALKVARAQLPDLILLDVVMPGIDGFGVLSQLKGDPDTADIPVIFVTAHGGEEIETQCLRAGAVDFIPKPINPNVVQARVRTHLTLKFQSDLLRGMAFIDGLTGVSNRRKFDDRFLVEWGRSQRNASDLTVLLMDVDHFKLFNDHYGHQAGDDCLRRIASALCAEARRPADVLARYGGEEFVCLLPETPFDDGVAIAYRMLQSVLGLGIAHHYSTAGPFVSVSVGVATREGAGSSTSKPAYLLALADAQLYEAKAAGRAQVKGARLPP